MSGQRDEAPVGTRPAPSGDVPRPAPAGDAPRPAPAGDATRPALAGIDTSVSHPARRYDYFLGGKDNFAADRESGDRVIAMFPTVRTAALENRRFMRRAVTHLAGTGIRQFLDIGSGIPTSPNTHEIAQAIAPETRVVYVDNDPIVLAHARALLNSTPEGATAYVDADLHHPERVLAAAGLRRTLDLSQPVALMLVAILHFIPDSEDPRGLIEPLIRAMPPGSHLILSHATYDFGVEQTVNRLSRQVSAEGIFPRSKAQLAELLDGLDLLDPGIAPIAEWRPESGAAIPTAAEAGCYGVVARIA